MHDFVSTCESCRMHSVVRHRDELHPTYPLTVHSKWMVDVVTMPMGEGHKRYLVLAREDLTNQVEGRALTNKTTTAVCRFLIEDVICRYGCVGKIAADRGELCWEWGKPQVRKRSHNTLFERKNLRMGDVKQRNTYRERERKRHKEYISINNSMQQLQMNNNLYKRLQSHFI